MDATCERWDVFEIRLDGPAAGNPFKEVELAAEFRHGHRVVSVAGFYAGEGRYRVRFMPDAEGAWSWRTRSSCPALDGHEGGFTCTPATAGNHGPVMVDATWHFRHADGTFYSCIGTTSYAWIHQPPALRSETLATLAHAPFNKLRMTIFPKSYPYNENEPDRYPFPLLHRGSSSWNGHWDSRGGRIEWRFDWERFDPGFFDELDGHLLALRDRGIQADIILFHPYDRWGFADFDEATDLFYLRYVVARLAAYRHVWWSLANEYDYVRRKNLARWETLARCVRENDPFGRLTGIHNGAVMYDQNRPWITHASAQSSDFDLARLRADYRKPLVYDEIGYEGDVPEPWGNLSARELLHRCWMIAVQGGYPGHSEVYYRPDEVMWWNKGGRLVGESVARLGFLRRLIESGPDCGIEPCPPGTGFATLGRKTADWIVGYTGVSQPRALDLRLPPGRSYRLRWIDPWAMTDEVQAAPVVTAGESTRVSLPGRPYAAFVLEAVG
jgi:hypothetical protein